MTEVKGNSEFCFPEALDVSRGEAKENIKGQVETKLTVSCGQVIKCFIILPNSKIEKNCENKICLT